jgi:hypothetical protein
VTDDERTLALVASLVTILDEHRVPHALVGATALAAHGYSRATEDVDIGVVVADLQLLKTIAAGANARLGVNAQVSLPDQDDPLGGVVTLSGVGVRQVQIINFVNPIGMGDHPGREAVQGAEPLVVGGASVGVVGLEHLVAMKLFAGGIKSQADVVELLAFNPEADLDRIALLCARFGLSAAWSAVLPEVRSARSPT